MTYLLLEGEFAENEKIQGLSDKAFRLHVTALTHCANNLTDGAISEIDLRKLGAISSIGRPNRVAKQLVSAGLWEANGAVWSVHDYLVHNPSRKEILDKRTKARSRKRKWRNESGNAGQDASVTRHKPPAWRRTTKDSTPPADEQQKPKLVKACVICGVSVTAPTTMADHMHRAHETDASGNRLVPDPVAA